MADSRDTIINVVCAMNQYDRFEAWLPAHGWESISEIDEESLDRALDAYFAYEEQMEPELPGLELTA